ncbi:MAG: CgeB family protein [Bacteriovoracaceae bacterium]|nr:CgeB family protein [Bacteriovoracaceae bacterium]
MAYRVSFFKLAHEFWNSWWIDTLAYAFKSAGHEVDVVPIYANDEAFSLFSRVKKFKADIIVSQNAFIFDPATKMGPELEHIISDSNIPVLYWYTDYPDSGSIESQLRWRSPSLPKNSVFIVADPTHEFFFKDRSLPVHYIHGGIDERLKDFRADPILIQELKCDISFVGGIYWLEEAGFSLKNPDQVPALFAFNGAKSFYKILSKDIFLDACKKMLSDDLFLEIEKNKSSIKENIRKLQFLLECFYRSNLTTAEDYCLAVKNLYGVISENFGSSLSKILELYAQRFATDYSIVQMIKYLREMEPLGLKVFGPQGWTQILPNGGASKCRMLHGSETINLYAASKIVFSHQKWQFTYCLHEREFLAGAVGTMPLVNYREAAEELFEPGDLVTWKTIEEAKDLAVYYLKNEILRKQKAERMRSRLFERHTWTHRVKKAVSYIESDLGMKQ